MGNAEARALTQSSPLVAEEVYAAHKQFLDYNRDFQLDRHAFGLLFSTDDISFQLIDQIYESLTSLSAPPSSNATLSYTSSSSSSDGIRFSDLAVGLVSGAAAIPLETKLNILFDAIDANGDGELVPDEVRTALSSCLVNSLRRLRGVDADGNGRVRYTDRRCAGCRETPVNLVYECVDCQQGHALGVPITVHLCKQCAPTWEGYGCNAHDMLHTKAHTLVKGRCAPNPHVVTHEGTHCDVCSVSPIIGTRYRCLECSDLTNLCEGCYMAGEQPGSHRTSHNVEALAKPVSLETQVAQFTNEILSSLDTNADGQITREEFLEWGLHNELASCLLRGFHIHDVRMLPFVEGCERTITTTAGVAANA